MISANTDLIVILVIGRIGAGKSTFCRLAQEEFGAHVISMADPLKELTKNVFDFTHDQVYGDFTSKETIDPRYGVSPRHMLQKLGEQARACISEDVWVNAVWKRIIDIDRHGYKEGKRSLVVVDSVRHYNEVESFERLQNRGALDLQVVKLVPLNHGREYGTIDAHTSEAAVDEIPNHSINAVFANDHAIGIDVFHHSIRSWLLRTLAVWNHA
jgi:hypothetical protein